MALSTIVGLDNKYIRGCFVICLAIMYGPSLSLLMNASTSLFNSGYRIIICFMFTYKYATMLIIQILKRFTHLMGSGWYELGLSVIDLVLISLLTFKIKQA